MIKSEQELTNPGRIRKDGNGDDEDTEQLLTNFHYNLRKVDWN